MEEELKYKLGQISDIWNHFILEYKVCKLKIKYDSGVETNYFGDILGYFDDTLDIIFGEMKSVSHSEKFSSQISFLQSIYVQQDFIEEMLLIFKCNSDKGILKQDTNYSMNRDLRNELVGHPIRKNYRGELISSCLFGYSGGNDKIVYLRYHKDNNYKFEDKEFSISEIISRHSDFLNKYFDEILSKLKVVVESFKSEIENMEKLVERKSFDKVLHLASVFYESIFGYDHIYDSSSLKTIYARKEEHPRYQNLIDGFYRA